MKNLLFLLISGILLCSFVDRDTLENERYTPLRREYAHSPVVPFHDTLFYIKTGIAPFSAQERAVAISERIKAASRVYKTFHADSLVLYIEGGIYEIAYGRIILMTISEEDAYLNGVSKSELANQYKEKIEKAIWQRYKDKRLTTILMRIMTVLLIIITQYLVVKLINFLFRKVSTKIAELQGTVIKTIKIKTYTLMDEKKTIKFILLISNIVKYVVIFVMFYLSIPLVLSVFPATQRLSHVLFSYIFDPLKNILAGIVEFFPNLITIIIIVMVFRYLIKGLRFMAEEIDKKRLTLTGFYSDWAYPTYHIVRVMLYAFMFVVIWPYLPFSEKPVFQGVSVFIGVIFTLGSTSVIGNVVSGLVLTYMRPFKIGDRIKIGEIVGNVIEKTPLVTRIRTPKNEEVTIPNSNIMTAQTFNYSESARTWGLILHTSVGIDYETPWRKTHELLIEAAKRTPDVQQEPKPFILQTALDDFYVQYQLNVYITDADKMAIIHSGLHQNIQDVFNEAGIELLSPHFQAQRDGSQVQMPEQYVPAGFKIPPIKVKVEK